MMIDGTATQRAVGMRFVNLAIPQGALVTSAWVQFRARESHSEATTVTIRGEAHDNARGFEVIMGDVTTRPLTAAAATWSAIPAWTAGQTTAAQRTPDLKDVIQEIVSRPGWASGNAIVLVVRGSGHRSAYAYEGGAANAPLLHVEYGSAPPPPPPVNQPPTANAGPDTTIASGGAAFLRGRATDDGLPGPLMTHWAAVSGPGMVMFDDHMAAVTRATFGASGAYRLVLTASDGLLEARDSVTITVSHPAVVNRAPTAMLSAVPSAGVEPLVVTLDASASSDPDGDMLTYAFDFGDGTAMMESCGEGDACCCAPAPCGCGHEMMAQMSPTATHEYAAGNWHVMVVVADGRGGADTASTVVTVLPNLARNPSFETGLTGWNANGTGVTVAQVAGGHHGSFAIEARGGASLSTFGVNDAPNVVNVVAGAGARYRFSAWVRSASHAGKAQLKVREYLGGVLQGTQHLSPAVTLGPAWQSLTFEVVAANAGSTLDFQIINKPVVASEVFQVDDIQVYLVPPALALLGGSGSPGVADDPVANAPAADMPSATRLAAVFPNPSPGAATMRFELAREAEVELEIYDLRGGLVKRIVGGRRGAGVHQETWDGRDRNGRRLPVGLYMVRFSADQHRASHKLVLTK
jgi:hypothetical protein